MFQFQISFGIRQNHGVLIVFCLRLLLDKIKYPLCTGKRVLKFGSRTPEISLNGFGYWFA